MSANEENNVDGPVRGVSFACGTVASKDGISTSHCVCTDPAVTRIVTPVIILT